MTTWTVGKVVNRGRFMKSLVRHEIRTVAADRQGRDPDGGIWIKVAQLRGVCQQSGALTNEARAVVGRDVGGTRLRVRVILRLHCSRCRVGVCVSGSAARYMTQGG